MNENNNMRVKNNENIAHEQKQTYKRNIIERKHTHERKNR